MCVYLASILALNAVGEFLHLLKHLVRGLLVRHAVFNNLDVVLVRLDVCAQLLVLLLELEYVSLKSLTTQD